MATFVVCTKCGRTREIADAGELPANWHPTGAGLLCPKCSGAEGDNDGDIIDEEVIYSSAEDADATLDEGYCEICGGPCQGH